MKKKELLKYLLGDFATKLEFSADYRDGLRDLCQDHSTFKEKRNSSAAKAFLRSGGLAGQVFYQLVVDAVFGETFDGALKAAVRGRCSVESEIGG